MATTTQPKWLTTAQVCELLEVSPSTFAKWRTKRVAPQAKRLPNGELRFREDVVFDWLEAL